MIPNYNQYSYPYYSSQIGEPIWVQGEEGAKAYNVPAGRTVILWDSENPIFYMKSVDQSGVPQPLRVFEFKERELKTPQYATMDEMKKYIDEVLKKNESTVQ